MNETTETCARCGEAIDITDGEPYVAFTIQWERMRRNRRRFWLFTATVGYVDRRTQTVALAHEGCTNPDLAQTVASAINDTLRGTR